MHNRASLETKYIEAIPHLLRNTYGEGVLLYCLVMVFRDGSSKTQRLHQCPNVSRLFGGFQSRR